MIEQAELAERARASRTGPQIAVGADARREPAAVVVPQHARAGRRLDERNAAAPAAARLGAALRRPVRRIEPRPRRDARRRRPRRRTGSRRRRWIGLARRSCLCQFPCSPSRSGRSRSLASPAWIKARTPAPPASLCLLRTSALGDVTHVVPLVRTLQRRLARDAPDLAHRPSGAQTRRRPRRRRVHRVRQARGPLGVPRGARAARRAALRRAAAHAGRAARESPEPRRRTRRCASATTARARRTCTASSSTAAFRRGPASTCSTRWRASSSRSASGRPKCAGTSRFRTMRANSPRATCPMRRRRCSSARVEPPQAQLASGALRRGHGSRGAQARLARRALRRPERIRARIRRRDPRARCTRVRSI